MWESRMTFVPVASLRPTLHFRAANVPTILHIIFHLYSACIHQPFNDVMFHIHHNKKKEPPNEVLNRGRRSPKDQETTSEIRVCAIHVGSASRESGKGGGGGRRKFNRSREPSDRGKERWRGVSGAGRDKECQNGSSRWQAKARGTHQKVDAWDGR